MVVSGNEDNRVATTTAGLRGTARPSEGLPHRVAPATYPLRTARGASVTAFVSRQQRTRGTVQRAPAECVLANCGVAAILPGNFAVRDSPRSCANGRKSWGLSRRTNARRWRARMEVSQNDAS